MSSRVLSDEEVSERNVSDYPYRHRDAAPRAASVAREVSTHDAAAEAERAAFSEGYAEGERAGRASADERVAAIERRLEESLKEISHLRKNLFLEAEHEVVQLALTVASKIIHREVAVDRDLVSRQVRACLDRASHTTTARVRLNPEDYRHLMVNAVDGRLPDFGPGVVLTEDAGIDPGGCVVETDVGTVDARIDSQLAEAEGALLGER